MVCGVELGGPRHQHQCTAWCTRAPHTLALVYTWCAWPTLHSLRGAHKTATVYFPVCTGLVCTIVDVIQFINQCTVRCTTQTPMFALYACTIHLRDHTTVTGVSVSTVHCLHNITVTTHVLTPRAQGKYGHNTLPSWMLMAH